MVFCSDLSVSLEERELWLEMRLCYWNADLRLNSSLKFTHSGGALLKTGVSVCVSVKSRLVSVGLSHPLSWWGCRVSVPLRLSCSSGCFPPPPPCWGGGTQKWLLVVDGCDGFQTVSAYVRKSLTSSTVSSPVESKVRSAQLRGESSGVSRRGEDSVLRGTSAFPIREEKYKKYIFTQFLPC